MERIGGMPCYGEFFMNCRHKKSGPLAGGLLTMSLQVPLVKEAMGSLSTPSRFEEGEASGFFSAS